MAESQEASIEKQVADLDEAEGFVEPILEEQEEEEEDNSVSDGAATSEGTAASEIPSTTTSSKDTDGGKVPLMAAAAAGATSPAAAKDTGRRIPLMAAVAEAAVAEASMGKKKEAAGISRTKSAVARDRWKLVNKHVKQKGSTFFGIDTEGGDHHARWEYRRRRMASKRYGTLKPEELSRQESAVSGVRHPPAFLDAVNAFASTKAPVDPRLQRYISDPQARARISRLQSMQGKLHPDALEAGIEGAPSDGAQSPPSVGRGSISGRSLYRSFRPKESVPRMAWDRLVSKTKPSTPPTPLHKVPTAKQVLERARSFKPSSLLDEFPPVPLAEKPPSLGKDAVDGELFFDIVGAPPFDGTTSAGKPVDGPSKLEVGGKGLPGGGTWKICDKPRSGPLGAFGKEDVEELEKVEARFQGFMDSALKPPRKRQLGLGVVGRILNRPMKSQSRVASNLKKQLEDIDDHRPFFTYWATTVQVIIMIITLAVYGFAPMGFERKLITGTVQTTNLAHEEVSFYEQQSFWLGPRSSDLIHLGAKYAPCMRKDDKIWKNIEQCRSREKESGCCILNDGGGCVQKYKSTDCSKTLAVFHKWGYRAANGRETSQPPCVDSGANPDNCEKRTSGPVCGQDPGFCASLPSLGALTWADDITKWSVCKKTDNEKAPTTAPEHMQCEVVGHPCCVGIKGQCRITTLDHCEFLKGYYHREATLCSQVSCLDDICGMISFSDPEKPDQVYRLWTSLFLHGGLLHLIITVIFQYVVMRDLEKMAGPVRIGIIYIGSGLAGNLASSIFLPYQAEVGPSGSQFGLLACLFVEVFQSWPLLLHPWRALSKLLMILLLLFVLGLLPWVDNYSHLFGFVFGYLLSFMVLPYVAVGKFDRRRKIVTIIVCAICFVGMFAALFLLFYVTPIYECKGCSYFNCIPITKHFCEDMKVEVDMEVEDCE